MDWKKIILTVSTLAWYGGLERTNYSQFLPWENVVVLKELNINSVYFVQVWWSSKN